MYTLTTMSLAMTRTQIYLPPEMLTHLKRVAEAEKTSVAGVIRRIIRTWLKTAAKSQKSSASVVQRLKEIRFKGEKNLSQKIDQLVYSRPANLRGRTNLPQA